MSDEVWREIPGWPNYEASNLGNIRRSVNAKRAPGTRPGRPLKLISTWDGYLKVQVWNNGCAKQVGVHRLVCMAFHGLPNGDHQASHEDGDRKNNRADNLSWKPPKENNCDKVRHGTLAKHERHGMCRASPEIVAMIRSQYKGPQVQGRYGYRFRNGPTIAELATQHGLSRSQVCRIVNGESWK